MFSVVIDGSWTAKKEHDAHDIKFLVTHMAQHNEKVAAGEVNFADEDFFAAYLALYPDTQDAWRAISPLQRILSC